MGTCCSKSLSSSPQDGNNNSTVPPSLSIINPTVPIISSLSFRTILKHAISSGEKWDDIIEYIPKKKKMISMEVIRTNIWGDDLLPSNLLRLVREIALRDNVWIEFELLPPFWFLEKYTDDVLLHDWKHMFEYIFTYIGEDTEAVFPDPEIHNVKGVLDLFSSWLDRMMAEATENNNNDNSNLRDEFDRRLIQHFTGRMLWNPKYVDAGVGFDIQNAIIKTFPHLVHDVIYYDLSSAPHRTFELRYERRGPNEYTDYWPQWKWSEEFRCEETIVEIELDDQKRKDLRQSMVVAYNGVWKERLLEYVQDSMPIPLLVIKSFFMSLHHSRYFADFDLQKRLGNFENFNLLPSWIVSMMAIEKEISHRFSTEGYYAQIIASVFFEIFDKVKLHPSQLDNRYAPYEHRPWRYLLRLCLNVKYPQALTQRNTKNGQLLLHSLLENGLPGQDILVKANLSAIHEVCPKTGFLPFQLAALPKNYFLDDVNDDSSNNNEQEDEATRLVSALEAEADQVTKIYNLLRFDPGRNLSLLN